MREFFTGWRRKLGVVTLLTACLFLGAWGRSHVSKDTFSLWDDGRIWNSLFLTERGIGFQRYEHASPFGCFTIVLEFVIPYWPIIAPLTVVSAFLLLSKPCTTRLKNALE